MSTNVFNDVLNNASGLKEKLMGPDYAYYKNIKSPSEIGMKSDGNLKALAKDVTGLISYVEVLVSGKSKASTTGGPLGNKFFLLTGAKCNDVATSQQVDRYIYVNNVPQGNIPFISSGLDMNFSDFKGLIPGTLSNMNVLNPFNILSSFMSGSTPDCQQITMQTIDSNNNSSNESHYVTTVDIKNMDPCNFLKINKERKNPVTGEKCREAFVSSELKMPNDVLTRVYFGCLSFLIIYILYRLMRR